MRGFQTAPRASPAQRAPCPRLRASPKLKSRNQQADIKASSHRLAVQHSVRSQRQDERQLGKLFKSLDDMRLKRLQQIDKEMAEEEHILEKLAGEREAARAERQQRQQAGRRGRDAGDTAEEDLSGALPDRLKRGPRPTVRRSSNQFDLYAFMMRRESDHSVVAYDAMDKTAAGRPQARSRKQSRKSPVLHAPTSNNRDLARHSDGRTGEELGTTAAAPAVSPSPGSIASLAMSVSLDSLPPSTPTTDDGQDAAPSPTRRLIPSPGPDRTQARGGARDVNRGPPGRARPGQRAEAPPATPTQTDTKAAIRTQPRGGAASQGRVGQGTSVRKGVTARSSGRTVKRRTPVGKLRKEVSFHFDDLDEGNVPGGGTTTGPGEIMASHGDLLALPSSAPVVPAASPDPKAECTEPDCIFHNRAVLETAPPHDYTIDDYYRAVSGKPAVSPLFVPAGTPRSWSRRAVVRTNSPTPSEFVRGILKKKKKQQKKKQVGEEEAEGEEGDDDDDDDDDAEVSGDGPPKGSGGGEPTGSGVFLSVRRPLKGSNRERMLRDKEENVRTTFSLMRQKMAERKPPEFNRNYGTPTPNWKILNPLKMRHKINQSNPLHVRWGL